MALVTHLRQLAFAPLASSSILFASSWMDLGTDASVSVGSERSSRSCLCYACVSSSDDWSAFWPSAMLSSAFASSGPKEGVSGAVVSGSTSESMKAAIAQNRGPRRPRGTAIRLRWAPTWTSAQARRPNRLVAPRFEPAARAN